MTNPDWKDMMRLAVITALSLMAVSAQAQVYNANADFNASLVPPAPVGTNPNGVWTYSWSDGLLGAQTVHSTLLDPFGGNCGAEVMWIDPNVDNNGTPSVAKSIYGPCNDGNVTFLQDELILHGGGVGIDGYAHLVFTPPQDTICDISATFTGRQNDVNADVHVIVNNVAVFSDVILVDGATTSYTFPPVFTSTNTISLAVGANGIPVQHPGNIAVEGIFRCNLIFEDGFETNDS